MLDDFSVAVAHDRNCTESMANQYINSIFDAAKNAPKSKELKMLLILLHTYKSKFEESEKMVSSQIGHESQSHLDPNMKGLYKQQLEVFMKCVKALKAKAA